jgi:hypothetical protein
MKVMADAWLKIGIISWHLLYCFWDNEAGLNKNV